MDNNCLHYAYMIDLPEVRQILRDNGLMEERATRLNRRGQIPTKLRHYTKAEDSNEETEDEDKYDAQIQLLETEGGVGGLDFGVVGTAIKGEVNPVL